MTTLHHRSNCRVFLHHLGNITCAMIHRANEALAELDETKGDVPRVAAIPRQ